MMTFSATSVLGTLALVTSLSAYTTSFAYAVEGGAGIYLLGSKNSFAGIAPPPGTYYSNDSYFYGAEADAGVTLPGGGGQLGVGLEADVFVNVNSVLHVFEEKVLGGNFGLGVAVPIVWKDITADATLTLGNAALSGATGDDVTAFGDPLIVGMLGWSEGNWHASLNGLLNIPIGQYEEGKLANAGFNRWAGDITLGLTYIDPEKGLDISIAPGFTFNGENLDTDYRSGTEFHVEVAMIQNFSESFGLGFSGYHYQQLSDDGGTAPRGFKGRASAIGPQINFNFKINETPISLKAKYFFEFDTLNRVEGDGGLIQLAFPLGGG